MIHKLCTLYFVILFVSSGVLSEEEVRVQTELGNVIGQVKTAINGKEIETFHGIPYGKAPIGELRFAHPQPFGHIGDNFEANKFGSVCSQPEHFAEEDEGGSEDCLFLEIYRPRGAASSSNLPVMVIIHGGGFSHGGSSDFFYPGDPLVEVGDIIVIVMNYRLGILGFADMGSIAPGNLGLFDQKLALEWIQQNIKSFGGDPQKVTLLGVSAGSMSVSAHIISPLTREKNLFQSAIMDGGVMAESLAVTQQTGIEMIQHIAEKFDCPISGVEMLECLRKVDSKNLTEASYDRSRSTVFTFQPTMDGIFLPKNIAEDLTTNADKYMKIPMIIGIAGNEGSVFARNNIMSTAALDIDEEEKFQKWAAVLFKSFSYPLSIDNTDTSKSLIETYFQKYNDKTKGVSDLLSDGSFICPINAFIKYYSRVSSNIFVYRFNRVLKNEFLFFDPKILGAFHAIPYFHFTGTLLKGGQDVDPADREFAIETMKMISEFAKTRAQPSFRGLEWPDFASDQKILEIDEHPSVSDGFSRQTECQRMFPYYDVDHQTKSK